MWRNVSDNETPRYIFSVLILFLCHWAHVYFLSNPLYLSLKQSTKFFNHIKQGLTIPILSFSCRRKCPSQWPRRLRHKSAAARLLWFWVRIPPGAWMSVCCDYCVLSARGLCNELITRPEESYRLWCVVVCDLEISWMRRSLPTGGFAPKNKHITCERK
jgi:hypothetical protein